MKVQIRQGVFETNSSSEHSVSVVREQDWIGWINGDLVARLKNSTEGTGNWGNFWSELEEWEFAESSQETELENQEILKKWIGEELIDTKEWITKPECPKTDLKSWNDYLEKLDWWKLDLNQVDVPTKINSMCWITFEEYMEFLRDGDCDSPFDHSVKGKDLHIFGRYFRS